MAINDTIARRSFLAGTAALAAGVPFVLNRRSLAQDASPVTVAGPGGITDIDALERVEVDLLPPPSFMPTNRSLRAHPASSPFAW